MALVQAADEAIEKLLRRYGSFEAMPQDAQTLVSYYQATRLGLEREADRIVREAARFK